jgi:probable HAF family extracellular repeat protein
MKLVPPGPNASGEAINDAGVVVGSFLRDGEYHHGFLWSPLLGFVDLGTPNGNVSFAYDVNNANQ